MTRISLVSLTHTEGKFLENQRSNAHLIMMNTYLALCARTQVPTDCGSVDSAHGEYGLVQIS